LAAKVVMDSAAGLRIWKWALRNREKD